MGDRISDHCGLVNLNVLLLVHGANEATVVHTEQAFKSFFKYLCHWIKYEKVL